MHVDWWWLKGIGACYALCALAVLIVGPIQMRNAARDLESQGGESNESTAQTEET